MIGQQVQLTGVQLGVREEYAISNWAGSRLPTTYADYDDARAAVDKLSKEAEKQGFDPEANKLTILRRAIYEIAAEWSKIG